MEFIDTHAHLPMLTHGARDAILARAREAGVRRMVTVATELGNWDSSQSAALADSDIYYTLGVHPHQAMEWAQCEPLLHERFAQGPPDKCVGIGETGLDFHYNYSDRETQLKALHDQLVFAKQHNLPIILHCRDAFADTFELVKKVGLCERGGVMHCFTGTRPDATQAVDLGLKVSFSGILTFRNAQSLREAAKALPLDSIVLETDCPYLAPIPHRGKPNEPAYLPQTAVQLAQTRGEPLETIAEATTRNASSLFGLG